jgi:sulfur carrier protein ThiS
MTKPTATDRPAPTPVTLTYRREDFTVRPGMTLRQAIGKCGLNPETVLAVRNGTLVTDDVVLEPGDRVKLVATFSGG